MDERTDNEDFGQDDAERRGERVGAGTSGTGESRVSSRKQISHFLGVWHLHCVMPKVATGNHAMMHCPVLSMHDRLSL